MERGRNADEAKRNRRKASPGHIVRGSEPPRGRRIHDIDTYSRHRSFNRITARGKDPGRARERVPLSSSPRYLIEWERCLASATGYACHADAWSRDGIARTSKCRWISSARGDADKQKCDEREKREREHSLRIFTRELPCETWSFFSFRRLSDATGRSDFSANAHARSERTSEPRRPKPGIVRSSPRTFLVKSLGNLSCSVTETIYSSPRV